MKPFSVLFLLCSLFVIVGCKHAEYRLVQPAARAQIITKEGMRVPYEPLEYSFFECNNQLVIQITNPTGAPIHLRSSRSYLVDPWGATHAVRDTVIAPHSRVDATIPPQKAYLTSYDSDYPWMDSYPYTHWNPLWEVDFGNGDLEKDSPYRVVTPYDWEWKTGKVLLHLGYECDEKFYDHVFVIDRE